MSEEVRRAFDHAGRALSTRDRTEAELRAYLERKRIDPEAIALVVADLCDSGLIDDARYAERFAEDKRHLQSWGRERIERDLERRGVPSAEIEAAMGRFGRAGERATALALLDGKFPGPLDSDRERDKAWRLLVRKGFEPELAYDLVRSRHQRAA